MGVRDRENLELALEQLTAQESLGVERWLRLPSILEQFGVSRQLLRIIQDVHANTWFRVPTMDALIKTHRGSRPGSPIADLIWHILMLRLHEEAEAAIGRQPQVVQAFETFGVPIQAITWADDITLPIATANADELLPCTTLILQDIIAAFRAKGLRLNLMRGKTTAVPTFRGDKAPQLRQEHLLQENPTILIQEDVSHHLLLPLSCSYRHLGSAYVPEATSDYEVNTRIGIAMQSYQELRKQIFTNKALQTTTRIRMLEILVLTKLFYGLQIWHNLCARTFSKLDAFVMRLVRQTIGVTVNSPEQTTKLTNAEILVQFDLPPLQLRLARCRLLYVAKVWEHGPQHLQHLLTCEETWTKTSWLHQIQDDLRWMTMVDPRVLEALMCPTLEVNNLQQTWCQQPRVWRRIVKRTCRLATLQVQAAATYDCWHSRIIDTMTNAGVVFNFNPRHLSGDQARGTLHQCWCQRSFQSTTALAVHQRKAHGQHAPEFALVKDVYCPCCLKNFWSLQRVRQHLAYMPRSGGPNRCFQQLMERGTNLETHHIERRSIPGALKGINRLEAIQLPGPLPLERQQGDWELGRAEKLRDDLREEANARGLNTPIQTMERATMWCVLTELTTRRCRDIEEGRLDTATYDIVEEWIEVLAQPGEDAYEEDVVFLRWGQVALPEIIQAHAEGQSERYLEEHFYQVASDCEVFHLEGQLAEAEGRVRALHRKLHKPLRGHRPVKADQPPQQRARRGLLPRADAYLCQEDREQRTRQLWIKKLPEGGATPRMYTPTLGPTFLVLHLFSGRRRDTDFHCKLTEMAQRLGLQVQILSLDVAVDQDYGNLDSRSKNWSMVARAVTNGWVAAAIAGSPCNTFSEARNHQLLKLKDNIGHDPYAQLCNHGGSLASNPGK